MGKPPLPDKPRKKAFSVGPANLPDGTYKRKGTSPLSPLFNYWESETNTQSSRKNQEISHSQSKSQEVIREDNIRRRTRHRSSCYPCETVTRRGRNRAGTSQIRRAQGWRGWGYYCSDYRNASGATSSVGSTRDDTCRGGP